MSQGHVEEPLGLCTDLYELRMVETYLRLGMLEPATFSLFARPSRERPFLLAAGIGRAMDVLEAFRYEEPHLAYLREQSVPDFVLEWLADFPQQGELWAVEDGTPVLANEPILEFTAPLPVAQLLETALINAVHFDTLIATKAARCVRAARGRDVVDFGFRRAHGLSSGIRAAIAAWIGGAASTSNVAAGRRAGIPISGTMAHSFVQAFDREIDAFREFATDHPRHTTLLVETYDPIEGIKNAVRTAKSLRPQGVEVQAIRIDCEPLDELAKQARAILDHAGLVHVRIFLSGGLDEGRIDQLVRESTPVDGFGVGSALVVSADKPVLDVAYKLAEYAGEGRAKYSQGKGTLPGRKQVYRKGDPAGDLLELREATAPKEGHPLLKPHWHDGFRIEQPNLERSRERARQQLQTLPDEWFLPPGPEKPPTPRVGPELERHALEVHRRIVERSTGATVE